jgi:hypothetical protein
VIAGLIFFATNILEAAYPKYQFGGSFSTFSGGGLCIQYEMSKSHVFVFNGIPAYYTTKAPHDKKYFYIFGGEYQYNLFKNKQNRLYAVGGLSYWYLEDVWQTEELVNDRMITTRFSKVNELFNVGVGFGYEIKFLNAFSLSANAVYQYQNSDKTHFDEIIDLSPKGTEYNGLGFGVALKLTF